MRDWGSQSWYSLRVQVVVVTALTLFRMMLEKPESFPGWWQKIYGRFEVLWEGTSHRALWARLALPCKFTGVYIALKCEVVLQKNACVGAESRWCFILWRWMEDVHGCMHRWCTHHPVCGCFYIQTAAHRSERQGCRGHDPKSVKVSKALLFCKNMSSAFCWKTSPITGSRRQSRKNGRKGLCADEGSDAAVENQYRLSRDCNPPLQQEQASFPWAKKSSIS